MERHFSTYLYLLAFIITSLVFAVGVLIGLQIGQVKTSSLEEEFLRLQSQTSVLELIALQNNVSGPALCDFYLQQLELFDKQTADFENKINYLSSKTETNTEEIKRLRSDYFVMQVRDYSLIQRINKQCEKKLNLVLFFYKKNCGECDRQLAELSLLKRESNFSVMVYSLDAESNNPVVSAMKIIYGVSGVPTVLFNENKLEGFHDVSSLKRFLLN